VLNILALTKLMRPHQYIKNLFIFLPLFFALKITDTSLLFNAVIAFIAFSLTASAIYTLNNYHDIEEDRQHPKKKERPLASGAISKSQAITIMSILFMVGFTLMTILSLEAAGILLAYVVMNIAYSFYLKHVAILDVVIIAIGFVLRLFIGSAVTDIPLSMWIVIMTFLLALFMALSKSRDHLMNLLSWGIYPKIRNTVFKFNKEATPKKIINTHDELIPYGKGSFLAVLKLYGKSNDSWLSFPIEGAALALDFKIEKRTRWTQSFNHANPEE